MEGTGAMAATIVPVGADPGEAGSAGSAGSASGAESRPASPSKVDVVGAGPRESPPKAAWAPEGGGGHPAGHGGEDGEGGGGGPGEPPEGGVLVRGAEKSLGVFGRHSRFRQLASRVAQSERFDTAVSGLIFLNCVFLGLWDNSKPPDDPVNLASTESEVGFTALFTVEVLVKVVAFGFIAAPGSYLRDPWNWLDFLVVVLGWVALLPGTSNMGAIRTLRLLRPLRTISNNPGLKVVANTLVTAIPAFADVVVLWVLVIIVFGIIGMQLFMGKLRYHCVDSLGAYDRDAVCGFTKCPAGTECVDRDPFTNELLENPNKGATSFDHLGWAMVVVFQTMTGEGWSVVKQFTDDGWSSVSIIYWAILILIGSFFIVNLAAAIMFASYERAASGYEKVIQVREALEGKEEAVGVGGQLDEKSMPGWRKWFLAIIVSEVFQSTIIFFILLNTITLAMEHDRMSPGYKDGLGVCNILFNVIFAVELVMKLLALGVSLYFKSFGNTFDALIVVFGIVEIVGERFWGNAGPKGLSVLRAFRLLRVVRLLKSFESLQTVLETVKECVKGIMDFSLILVIVIYTFALMGMSFFGDRLCQEWACSLGQFDDRASCVAGVGEWQCVELPAARFTNAWWSIMAVFQCMTGENWHIILYNSFEAVGGGSVVFFVLVVGIGKYILLNLFLAGIIQKVLLVQREVLTRHMSDEDRVPKEETMSFTIKERAGSLASKIGSNKYFDGFIILCIIISSLLLAIEVPGKDSAANRVIENFDYVFTTIFLFEAAVKMAAAGLYGTKKEPGYFRDGWNLMDFFIVLISLTGIITKLAKADGLSALNALKAIRSLRALRPLRVLSRAENLKVAVAALFDVVGEVGNVLLLLSIVWLIFAILGVQLMGGMMYSCSDPGRLYAPGAGPTFGANVSDCPGGPGCPECTGEMWWDGGMFEACASQVAPAAQALGCFLAPRTWTSPRPNFNNVGEAFLSIFELATLEDWDEMMTKGIAVTEVGAAPSPGHQPAIGLYFLLFILLGGLFFGNLLISTVVERYLRAKETGDANTFLTRGQQAWVDTYRMSLREKPERKNTPPKSPSRLRMFHVVLSQPFDVVIMLCIVLNVVVMMIDYNGASAAYVSALEYINLFFSAVFLVEAVLKLYGLGRQYWLESWNVFDFTIVVLSIIGFVLSQAADDLPIDPSFIRVLRVFRTARVLKMVKRAKGLRMIISTFITSIPSLWNIGALLFLSFFVFAILGMNLFYAADFVPGVIDGQCNFRTFRSSLYVVFRSLTGEGWQNILHELMDQDFALAIPFFLLFFIFVYFLMINLFVAVILDNFTEARRIEDSMIDPSQYALFSHLWQMYDPEARHTIPVSKLLVLLERIEPPLGLKGKGYSKLEKLRFFQSLELTTHGEEQLVHYFSVLSALGYRVTGEELPGPIQDQLKTRTEFEFKSQKKLPKVHSTLEETYAVIRFQTIVRGFLEKKKTMRRLATLSEADKARVRRKSTQSSYMLDPSKSFSEQALERKKRRQEENAVAAALAFATPRSSVANQPSLFGGAANDAKPLPPVETATDAAAGAAAGEGDPAPEPEADGAPVEAPAGEAPGGEPEAEEGGDDAGDEPPPAEQPPAE